MTLHYESSPTERKFKVLLHLLEQCTASSVYYCVAPWPKSNLRRVHSTHFIWNMSSILGNIHPPTSWWAEVLGLTKAFLVSWESKASGIPRKNPQHRTGSLAYRCFLPARDTWQSHDSGWGMPWNSPWHWPRESSVLPVTRTTEARIINKFGEERKWIHLGRTDLGSFITNLPKSQPGPWTNSVIL